MTGRHDDLTLRIAEGTSDLGRVKNKSYTWEELRSRLNEPQRDLRHTLEDYLKLPVKEQHRLKNVGFFVGGHCDDGLRKARAIRERSIVSLDIDSATAAQMEKFHAGWSDLLGFEWVMHTTRKHSAKTPRWRMVIPLVKPVPADRYGPLSRILASRVFGSVAESMEAVDDVSFRLAQVMYWPSVCRGSDFDFLWNEGKLLDGDSVLEEFGDWQDWTKLPYSESRSRKKPTDPTRKAEDPTTKRGLVGAFCRAYDVEEAIATFLSDIYVPGDENSSKPRYTYVHGSTSNGAIVEDGGLFLYSHHGTDPCAEKLVNSFDMVRLHLFGNEDAESPENTTPTNLPSFKAMREFLEDDVKVIRELQADNYDIGAMFDDLEQAEEDDLIGSVGEEKPAKAKDRTKTEWFDTLDIDNQGQIKPTVTNVAVIVQNDPRFTGCASLNEFTGEIVAKREIKSKIDAVPVIHLLDRENGDAWGSRHDLAIRGILEAPRGKGKAGYGMRVTDRDLVGGIQMAAMHNKVHPVREYLCKLKWDGKRRLDRLFVDFLGAPNTPYHQQAARLFLVAAVTRIFEPGHKFDYTVILEGTQGLGKSTFARILGRDRWFNELHGDLGDRKVQVENMMGYWILELPELAGMRKTEVDDTKAFISAQKDVVRLAWERRSVEFRRQQVFIGTTNDRRYLRDETGNRRFWPIKVEVRSIDIERLDAEMDLIWAEAVDVYRQMREKQKGGPLPLYLRDERAAREAYEMQESRRTETAEEGLAGQITEWLETPVPLSQFEGSDSFDNLEADSVMVVRNVTCLREIWSKALGRDDKHYNQREAMSLGRAMRFVPGWEQGKSKRRLPIYGPQWLWWRDGRETIDLYRVVGGEPDDLVG